MQSNWGGEFRVFSEFLKNEGIHHGVSYSAAHQHNGIVECKHRHMVENGLAFLANASLPSKFWDEAFLFSVFSNELFAYNPFESQKSFRSLISY